MKGSTRGTPSAEGSNELLRTEYVGRPAGVVPRKPGRMTAPKVSPADGLVTKSSMKPSFPSRLTKSANSSASVEFGASRRIGVTASACVYAYPPPETGLAAAGEVPEVPYDFVGPRQVHEIVGDDAVRGEVVRPLVVHREKEEGGVALAESSADGRITEGGRVVNWA